MITKKEYVKKIILEWDHRIYTINYAHRMITGSDGAMRYHAPLVECSKSTIRRAFDELVCDGKFESYYHIGHCYDPVRFRRLPDAKRRLESL